MKNSDRAARPVTEHGNMPYEDFDGLTKREHYIGVALQGLLVNAGRNGISIDDCHLKAIDVADKLLVELGE